MASVWSHVRGTAPWRKSPRHCPPPQERLRRAPVSCDPDRKPEGRAFRSLGGMWSSQDDVTETNVTDTVAVRAENLFKVFGRRAQDAVKQLKDGASRSEVAPLGTAAVIDASFEVKKGE